MKTIITVVKGNIIKHHDAAAIVNSANANLRFGVTEFYQGVI